MVFKKQSNLSNKLKLTKSIYVQQLSNINPIRFESQQDTYNITMKIISLYGNDNSLTHKGIQEKLRTEYDIILSIQKIGRIIRASGLKRKRIHKKSKVLLNDSHKLLKREY